MANLYNLSDIPTAARKLESAARKQYPSRTAALDAATYRIEVAPGCHSRPHFDPPVLGWTITEGAAKALSERLTHMPDGSSHRMTTYTKF